MVDWTQQWSRADAVKWFGAAAVTALEGRGGFPGILRPVRTGPFSWVACEGHALSFWFLVDGAWQEAERGPRALELAVARAMPTGEDLHYVVDVIERLTDWRIDESREPPHEEHGAIAFVARRPTLDWIRVVIHTEMLHVDVSVIE